MSETQATPPQSNSPGQILKRAREAKSLTVAAIATQMNLDLRIVEALEAGDHSKLPAPIFVRGYLRGYARLVEVPEAAVLDAYQAQAPEEPVPRAVGMAPVAPLRPALRRSAIPWRGLLTVVVLVALAAAGFLFGPQLLQQFTALAPMTGTAARSTSPDRGLTLPAPQPVPSPADADVDANAPVPSMPETDEPADDPGALSLPLPAPAPQSGREAPAPPPLDAAAPTSPPEEDFSAAGDASSTVVDTATADKRTVAPAVAGDVTSSTADLKQTPSTAPTSTMSRLVFRFTQQSWVEVRDADGNKLLFGLYGSGETRDVSGKPPISVLLGNASAVELRVDGKPFNVAGRSRDNIARFRITAGN